MKKLLIVTLCIMLSAVFSVTGMGEGFWSCPTCGANNDSEFNFCPKDGTAKPSALQVGDTLTFGSFELDGNTYNGLEPIEWIVLNIDEKGNALLLTKEAIINLPYSQNGAAATWETSYIRTWLNSEFSGIAFNADEAARIQTTTVTNSRNPMYQTDCGNDTVDNVFLLSINDIEAFVPQSIRVAHVNGYIRNNKHDAVIKEDGSTQYWLRDVGEQVTDASCVNSAGDLVRRGTGMQYFNCVRPAMIININGLA